LLERRKSRLRLAGPDVWLRRFFRKGVTHKQQGANTIAVSLPDLYEFTFVRESGSFMF
jgi:hypothetical protein